MPCVRTGVLQQPTRRGQSDFGCGNGARCCVVSKRAVVEGGGGGGEVRLLLYLWSVAVTKSSHVHGNERNFRKRTLK
jgi:hypothetical protein